MQRIVFCTDSLMAGGTEQQLVELVTRLDTRRYEPMILCLYGERAGRSLHFLPRLRECGIPVTILDLDWTAGSKLRGLVEIWRYLWRVKPDVVQPVNYHSNLLVRLASPALPRSVRLIGCVYVEYTWKQLVYERLSAWRCDALVCNSRIVEQQLCQVAGEVRIEVIPNGIDLDRFAGTRDAMSGQHRVCGSKRVLLFVGRIAYQKSPHLLAQALGILKDWGELSDDVVAWVVGEVEDAAEQAQLESVIAQYDLADVVVQFLAVDDPERFYEAAHLLVLPSQWEGLPNVTLEALASGLPVIVSDAANRDGVVMPGSNGWEFPNGDAVRLAEILRFVLGNDGYLSDMRLACRKSVCGYGVEDMVGKYQQLYDGLRVTS